MHPNRNKYQNSNSAVVSCGYTYFLFIVEMGRSSVNAEVRPNNSAECSARFGSATCDYSAEVRPNFGKNSASLSALLSRYFAGILPLFAVPPAIT